MLFPFFIIWAISHIRQVNFSITIVILANHAVIGLLVQTTATLKAMISKKMDRLSIRTDDPFIDLWKDFFNTIGIKERANYQCQRNLMPLWYRKHMTEFQ